MWLAGGRKPDSVGRRGDRAAISLAPPCGGTPRSRGVRLIPEMCPARAGRPGRAVIPVLSCTARGLSCRGDRSPRGGLLPRLFNLGRRGDRYVFCDTFRGGGLAPVGPALARGVLPRGVRTFLCAGQAAQRPPATRQQKTTPHPPRPQPRTRRPNLQSDKRLPQPQSASRASARFSSQAKPAPAQVSAVVPASTQRSCSLMRSTRRATDSDSGMLNLTGVLPT